MECSMEKSTAHPGSHFLGNSKWSERSVLDGLLATTPSFTIKGQPLPLSISHPIFEAPQSGGSMAGCLSSPSLAQFENVTTGPPCVNKL
jgi:hypothetical protein